MQLFLCEISKIHYDLFIDLDDLWPVNILLGNVCHLVD